MLYPPEAASCLALKVNGLTPFARLGLPGGVVAIHPDHKALAHSGKLSIAKSTFEYQNHRLFPWLQAFTPQPRIPPSTPFKTNIINTLSAMTPPS